MCFVNRVCRVKHTDQKRFWSVRLHGTLGPFGGDMVVTCTCMGIIVVVVVVLAEVRVRDWRYCVVRMGD